jgi:hypothetical protein
MSNDVMNTLYFITGGSTFKRMEGASLHPAVVSARLCSNHPLGGSHCVTTRPNKLARSWTPQRSLQRLSQLLNHRLRLVMR